MRYQPYFVKYSYLFLYLALILIGGIISFSSLGQETFLLNIWKHSNSNPLFFISSGLAAFLYGYLRAFRKDMLKANFHNDLFWWTIMPCILIQVLYLSTIFTSSYLLTGQLIETTSITTDKLLIGLIPLWIGAGVGHITGSAKSKPHYDEFLHESVKMKK